MRSWTMEALKELKKESGALVFVVAGVTREDIYKLELFEKRVWYRPDQEKAVGLFEG